MRSVKARRLRETLGGSRITRAVGAHDGLTAKLVERSGFEAVWASSFELSASRGLPDASLVTMTQYLDAAVSMDAVVDLPVIADCDTGFGGPRNAAYAARLFERAGIAAICMEDKVFPKLNSFADADQELVPVDAFTDKVRAAKAAQAEDDFVVIARTEALIAGRGAREAYERAVAYADAGADAILVHSRKGTADEVLEVAAMWDGAVPLVAVPTSYADVDEATLYAAGFRLVIYANQGLRAAVRSVERALRMLSDAGRASAVEDELATMADVFALQDMPVGVKVER